MPVEIETDGGDPPCQEGIVQGHQMVLRSISSQSMENDGDRLAPLPFRNLDGSGQPAAGSMDMDLAADRPGMATGNQSHQTGH